MKAWLRSNWQYLMNIALFLIFMDVAAHQIVLKVAPLDMPSHEWYLVSMGRYFENLSAQLSGGEVDSDEEIDPSLLWYSIYVDWSWMDAADWSRMRLADWAFAAQSILIVSLVLIRRRHIAMDGNIGHQAVAIIAFCSGVFFIGDSTTDSRAALTASTAIILAANTLAVFSLFHLGRSFGILISLRKVKTGGVYSVVRHPMYCSDILVRAGYLIGRLNLFTIGLFLVSSAAYVWRAIFEERFLERREEYRAYKRKVRYRFIPGVW